MFMFSFYLPACTSSCKYGDPPELLTKNSGVVASFSYGALCRLYLLSIPACDAYGRKVVTAVMTGTSPLNLILFTGNDAILDAIMIILPIDFDAYFCIRLNTDALYRLL